MPGRAASLYRFRASWRYLRHSLSPYAATENAYATFTKPYDTIAATATEPVSRHFISSRHEYAPVAAYHAAYHAFTTPQF